MFIAFRCPGWSSGQPTVLRRLRFPSVLSLEGFCEALNVLEIQVKAELWANTRTRKVLTTSGAPLKTPSLYFSSWITVVEVALGFLARHLHHRVITIGYSDFQKSCNIDIVLSEFERSSMLYKVE